MVWQGAHSTELVRKIVAAQSQEVQMWNNKRGFLLDSYIMADTDGRAVRNLIHASGSARNLEAEIKHWFKSEELVDYL